MTETNNIKIYVEEQLKAVSNRIEQHTTELSSKINNISDSLDESVKRMETQRYVDRMATSAVLDEINDSLATLFQQN